MPVNEDKYSEIASTLKAKNVRLVAVSKVQSTVDIKKLYDLGQRDFGENYVQELVKKFQLLPTDIHWHFIGHLQSNKVKFIAPFVHLIQGVDSFKLLNEINKQATKYSRRIHCLLQIHIAQEETKFGLNEQELEEIMEAVKAGSNELSSIYINGFMGMASFSNNIEKVKEEMKYLKSLLNKYQSVKTHNCQLSILSMGMSGDYEIAVEQGSNMVRIGSLLFGARALK